MSVCVCVCVCVCACKPNILFGLFQYSDSLRFMLLVSTLDKSGHRVVNFLFQMHGCHDHCAHKKRQSWRSCHTLICSLNISFCSMSGAAAIFLRSSSMRSCLIRVILSLILERTRIVNGSPRYRKGARRHTCFSSFAFCAGHRRCCCGRRAF